MFQQPTFDPSFGVSPKKNGHKFEKYLPGIQLVWFGLDIWDLLMNGIVTWVYS